MCGTLASAQYANLIQLEVLAGLCGRVMSLYTLTLIGIPSMGSLLAGIGAEVTGVRIAVGAAAVMVALLTLAAYARRPELRRVE